MNELPHNLEAEQLTLGSVLVNRESLIPIASWLKPAHFSLEKHALIYEAMLRLYSRRETPIAHMVLAELKRMGQQQITITTLLELTEHPIATLILDYAREVERTYVLRRLVDAGTKIAALGYRGDDAGQALADAQAALGAITRHGGRTPLVSLATLADAEYKRLEQHNDGQPASRGALTGLRDLDEITGGLQNQDFIILAARPSIGKSSMMTSWAYGIAEHATNGRDVLIYSLEMAKEQLHHRLIAKRSRIDTQRIRHLFMNETDSQEYLDAIGWLAGLPVYIDDTPAVNLSYIRTASYRHQAEHGRPLVVFVDYVQLMVGQRSENRVQEISAISRGMKALAKELDCPVIGLSQLSRAVETRESKVPLLSDLRESGSLEQDADVVAFIYRDEVYNKDTDQKGIAELHIAKHRNGPIGVVPLRFDAATTSFDDLTYRAIEGY